MAREELKEAGENGEKVKMSRAERKKEAYEKRMEKVLLDLKAQLSYRQTLEDDEIEVVKAKGHQLVVKGKMPCSRNGLADWWFGHIGTAASYVAFTMNRYKPGRCEQTDIVVSFVSAAIPGEVVTFRAFASQTQLSFEASAMRDRTEVMIAKGSSLIQLENPQLLPNP